MFVYDTLTFRPSGLNLWFRSSGYSWILWAVCFYRSVEALLHYSEDGSVHPCSEKDIIKLASVAVGKPILAHDGSLPSVGST